jgi:predicted CoA-binding protein
MTILKTIMAGIKEGDKSFFFENYERQAKAVVKHLERAGYVIAPLEPDEAMAKAGSDSIMGGHVRPEKHVQDVYKAMVKSIKHKKV